MKTLTIYINESLESEQTFNEGMFDKLKTSIKYFFNGPDGEQADKIRNAVEKMYKGIDADKLLSKENLMHIYKFWEKMDGVTPNPKQIAKEFDIDEKDTAMLDLYEQICIELEHLQQKRNREAREAEARKRANSSSSSSSSGDYTTFATAAACAMLD